MKRDEDFRKEKRTSGLWLDEAGITLLWSVNHASTWESWGPQLSARCTLFIKLLPTPHQAAPKVWNVPPILLLHAPSHSRPTAGEGLLFLYCQYLSIEEVRIVFISCLMELRVRHCRELQRLIPLSFKGRYLKHRKAVFLLCSKLRKCAYQHLQGPLINTWLLAVMYVDIFNPDRN